MVKRAESIGCPFCRIAGDEPERVLMTSGDSLAFLSRQPIKPGHTLVIPRRHILELAELSQAELTDVFNTINLSVAALRSVLKMDGYNLAVNLGRAAGQSVPHLHFHVLPRNRGDIPIARLWFNPLLLFHLRKQSADKRIELTKRLRAYLS